MAIISEHRLIAFADYHQIHVVDADRNEGDAIGWTDEDVVHERIS